MDGLKTQKAWIWKDFRVRSKEGIGSWKAGARTWLNNLGNLGLIRPGSYQDTRKPGHQEDNSGWLRTDSELSISSLVNGMVVRRQEGV